MKFLIDENISTALAEGLQNEGHAVRRVRQIQAGAADPIVIELAAGAEVILTEDKDFADHVFRDHYVVLGVVLLRLDRLPSESQTRRALRVIAELSQLLVGRMTVIFPAQIRQRDVPD